MNPTAEPSDAPPRATPTPQHRLGAARIRGLVWPLTSAVAVVVVVAVSGWRAWSVGATQGGGPGTEPSPTQEWTRTAAPATVRFTATVADLSFEGRTPDVDVEETEQHIVVVIGLESLSTDLELRDQLMREHFLEVEQFPEARLEVLRADLQIPDDVGRSSPADVPGALSLHGETQDITFRLESSCNAAALCDIVGDTVIVMTDFGIPLPVYRGNALSPEIAIHATFQVQHTPSPPPPPDQEPAPPPTLPPPPLPSAL